MTADEATRNEKRAAMKAVGCIEALKGAGFKEGARQPLDEIDRADVEEAEVAIRLAFAQAAAAGTDRKIADRARAELAVLEALELDCLTQFRQRERAQDVAWLKRIIDGEE